MLFKKTVKAAFAATLWMVALLGANSAMAAVDLKTGKTPVVFAQETLLPLTGVAGFHAVTASGDGLTVTLPMGLTTISARSAPLWVRYDLSGGAVLTGNGALTAENPDTSTPPNYSDVGLAEAAAYRDPDGKFVLWEVPETDALLSGARLSFNLNGAVIVSTAADGKIRGRIFTDDGDAVNERDALVDEEAVFVKTANGIKTTVSAAPGVVAEVGVSFLQLQGALLGGTTLLGTVKVEVDTTTKQASDGEAMVDFEDVISFDPAQIGLSVEGDGGFAFGTFGIATPTDTAACPTPDELTFKKGEEATGPGTATLVGTSADVSITRNLCVTIKAANSEEIPEGAYTADVTFNALANATAKILPMAVDDATIADIGHNGTTVDIPYLTSYDGYVQRIVIVNRNKGDTPYTITYGTEDDSTADPMDDSGSLDGGTTTVMKVHEMVTFSPKTRGSARLNIVSSPSMVDVATTMVNKEDQSTDTVVLHLGKRDG